jgi:septal ring factor EnvC (AmiA/AmiB activator)
VVSHLVLICAAADPASLVLAAKQSSNMAEVATLSARINASEEKIAKLEQHITASDEKIEKLEQHIINDDYKDTVYDGRAEAKVALTDLNQKQTDLRKMLILAQEQNIRLQQQTDAGASCINNQSS